MSQDEFLNKWRYQIAGILFSASSLNGADSKTQRLGLLLQIEQALRDMFIDLNVPPGPVHEEILAHVRGLYKTCQRLSPTPVMPVALPAPKAVAK